MAFAFLLHFLCSILKLISGECLFSQKAHVQQFLASEDTHNKAAEARNLCQKLIKRLHGNGDVVSSHSIGVGGSSQNVGSLRQFEVT